MPKFILKRGKPINAMGEYRFEAGVPVHVTDEAMVKKLKKHKSFEEVSG